MLTLRLTQSALADGQHRVEAALEGGAVRSKAESVFSFELADADRERLRWYLEDYLEYPLDPAPELADGVETWLRDLGVRLFRELFGSEDGRDLWARLRERLPETRVEIASEVTDATALPWELLRDPKTDVPLALRAREFVHVHHAAAQEPRLPEAVGERLRVLLVVCRPDGRADVPFRSVASHLVRMSADTLEVDVLRPPTFERLTEVLHEAKRRGEPYQVVHFDGHGTYADALAGELGEASTLRYARSGRHGYLLFEHPGGEERQLVDGPALGALLAETGVPVLVLNACRSAYAEAPTEPAAPDDPAAADVHARVRAYGSLAQEVADAGVPGVVAMRYSVYVVTAARFIRDLYGALLSGQALGEAVETGRRQLAANPERSIAFEPRPLQDWVVPVVYETAPLALCTPQSPRITVEESAPADGGLPLPPDVGFFGRDETLLALDRAFDAHRVVLLHAYAGAGKTTTAAEFARWYSRTGGLRDGLVLFSSFEQYLPLPRLLDRLADAVAPLLEANNIHWLTLDDARRRQVAMSVLKQVPVLWVWDNVEPVAGFPTGARSAWSADEQRELADFLREVAAGTRAKVLLTSRRDEQAWLGELPARVELPAMPFRESIQLTQALAAKRGHRITEVRDWRPLLRYAAGNPLTITVLVGHALRQGLTTRDQLEALVARLRAGEVDLGGDAAQGRSASLAASLDYGFSEAFAEAEQARLAVLHLFQDTVDVAALVQMGAEDNEHRLPEVAGLTREAGIRLLHKAAEVGLLTPYGGGYYRIHPALPWYFARLFTATYGPPGDPAADRVLRAYVAAVAGLGNYYHREYGQGRHQVIGALAAEEANLLRARAAARAHGWWPETIGCMQGLRVLYNHLERRTEWARLVAELVPDLTEPATGGPRHGWEEQWSLVTEYRVRLAWQARNWAEAERLQGAVVAWRREQVREALEHDPDRLDDGQRNAIRNLAVGVQELGHLLREPRRSDCVELYQQAVDLYRRIGDRRGEATVAYNLGHAHLDIPALRDLDEAERWYRRSLELIDDHDTQVRAATTGQLGRVALQRFHQAREAAEPDGVLLAHLDAARAGYHDALELLPAAAAGDLAVIHNQLGIIYAQLDQTETALRHFQKAIQLREQMGDAYTAGLIRENVGILLARAGRPRDALLYYEAALRDYERYGATATEKVENVRDLIAHAREQIDSDSAD